jgi:peroxiredoxin
MMTELLKKIVIAIIVSLLSAMNLTRGQDIAGEDTAAVKQAALDYAEGYYSGDAARMERAIHPDLNKATPRDLPQTGRTILAYTTYSSLMEYTRGKTGFLTDTARHISVTILSLENDVANILVTSAKFIDYLQEIRLDGQWKIVNVLFTSGLSGPPRMKDFNPDAEKPSILVTLQNYLGGLAAGDAGRLGLAIGPELNRITLNAATGEVGANLRRQRYEALMETTLAGIGKQDEFYRNYRCDILDVRDGMAMARCVSPRAVEYVQLYKGNGDWKIFNSIVRPNNGLTFGEAMTVIAGDPMPDFELPVYGGGTFNLSGYRGKNVLLMFPRGWVGNSWCAYCPYQYLELEQMVKEQKIKSKYDLEIAFVMPYSEERIKDWMEKFPEALAQVERIKKPDPSPAPGSLIYDYSGWVAEKFPIVFTPEAGDPHTLIPVLADEDRALSRQLKIFTNFWDGATSEQNMASVFIIDKKGVLRFKYIGQMTEDRPDVNYLLDVIGKLE